MKNKPLSHVRSLYALDLRSIALFRICMGFLVFLDSLGRLGHVASHYSDSGVLPRSALTSWGIPEFQFSLHMASGHVLWQIILLVLAALSGLALMVGYRSRWAVFTAWILIISVQSRNFLVNNAGDILIRNLLLWANFLPLAACWSLDSRFAKKKPAQMEYADAPALAITAQLVIMYFTSALLKSGQEWQVEGTAAYYAMSLDHLTRPFGRWLLNFPDFLTFSTFATLYWEKFAAFLFFVPFFRGWLKFWTVVGFITMHLFFESTLHIGLFAWTDIAGLLILLPTSFWTKAEPWLNRRISSLAHVWRKFLTRTQQKRLEFTYSMFMRYLFRIEWVRSYRVKTLVPSSMAASCLCTILLAYIIVWNSGHVSKSNHLERNRHLRAPAQALRIDQKWDMFAAFPTKNDGWFVMEGQLRDGNTVDVWNRGIGRVSYEKPDDVPTLLINERWRKYLMNLYKDRYKKLRPAFSKYLCQRWNSRAASFDKRLTSVKVSFVLEKTPPPGQKAKHKIQELWNSKCD